MPHKPLAASEGYYAPDTPMGLYADVIRELDLVDLPMSESRVHDGENIAGILKGTQTTPLPIFTAHNERIITIRDSDKTSFLPAPIPSTAPPQVHHQKSKFLGAGF